LGEGDISRVFRAHWERGLDKVGWAKRKYLENWRFIVLLEDLGFNSGLVIEPLEESFYELLVGIPFVGTVLFEERRFRVEFEFFGANRTREF